MFTRWIRRHCSPGHSMSSAESRPIVANSEARIGAVFLRRHLGISRQAVVELDPIHLFRDPDMRGRRKGVAVVEGGEGDTGHGADLAPGEQACAAGLAEHPVEL